MTTIPNYTNFYTVSASKDLSNLTQTCREGFLGIHCSHLQPGEEYFASQVSHPKTKIE